MPLLEREIQSCVVATALADETEMTIVLSSHCLPSDVNVKWSSWVVLLVSVSYVCSY